MDAIIEYINKGGVFMYPIIFGVLWAMTLLLERTIFYMNTATLLTKQSGEIVKIISDKGIPELRKYLLTKKGIIKNILTAVVSDDNLSAKRAEGKIEIALVNYLPQYSRGLNLIATLAGMMPMLGLLGTVTGMIATFKVIALQGTGDAQAMADGISVALVTTQAGLLTAIPITLGYTFVVGRLKVITDKTKVVCGFYIDYLKDREDDK